MADVVSVAEIEHIVSQLATSPLEWVGNEEWSRQMSMLEQLNVQAAVEADRGGEEKVRDCLVESARVPLIVHEILILEQWRQRILPRILARGKPQTTFQIYMVLFNEANLNNILESILFGASACEALDESAIDLVDYCLRNLAILVSTTSAASEADDTDSLDGGSNPLENWEPGQDLPHIPVEDVLDELKRHEKELAFQIAMKSLSVIRYITDHLENMVLGVATRLVITHDVPVLLSQLLQKKPWFRLKDGKAEVFHGSDWIKQDNDDGRIPKLEAQVWIALYNLLSKSQCADKYELHNYRLDVITKLADQINENLEMQLPILTKLREWLLRLSLAKPTATGPTKDLVLIEAVAEIHDSLVARYTDTRCDEIAGQHAEAFLGEVSEAWKSEAGKILDMLESDAAINLLEQQHTKASSSSGCFVCHAPDPRSRCSRCRKARYCSRECQTRHWPSHKKSCVVSSVS